MAKLSKKKEAPIAEETVEEVVQEAIVETVTSEDTLTHEEFEAIQKAKEEEENESADTMRLQLATNLVSKKFNLDPSYSVKNLMIRAK